jgi:tetratricopeptide (TPR) repeat protein
LGQLYFERGRLDAALDYQQRALSTCEATMDKDKNSSQFTTCLTSLSDIHQARKELTVALDYAQRAWSFHELHDMEKDKVVGQSLARMSKLNHSLGNQVEALRLGTRALPFIERSESSNSEAVADLVSNIGRIQMDLNDFSEAKRALGRAARIYTQLGPNFYSKAAQVDADLHQVLMIQQRIKNPQRH